MKISVIISVYVSDNPTYFSRAIQSIWDDQTLKPDEIILIKDGPLTEELDKIIDQAEEHIHEHLRIIQNTTNIGLTKSLNRGIKEAKSQYIARMDSDDISLPQRFELQAAFLDEHPDVHVVGGSIQEFSSENNNLNIRKYPCDNEAVLNYIHIASPLAHPTVMMRRDIFENGIKYNERYRTSQDISLWFDILAAGYKIANLDTITLKFRRGNDIYSRRSKRKALNELMIYLHGIRRLNGIFTSKYIFPLSRFIFRMMPLSIIKLIYNSKFRLHLLRS